MNQPHNSQRTKNANQSSEPANELSNAQMLGNAQINIFDTNKAHDFLQQNITELFKTIATDPNMPNGTSIKKAADCIGRLTHIFVDYLQHNIMLVEENRELYRQLELRGAECDSYLDEISILQQHLQHWKEYYAANADLFAPDPVEIIAGSQPHNIQSHSMLRKTPSSDEGA